MKKTLLSLTAIATILTSTYANDKVYATVNGENITSKDISMLLRDPRVQFETIPEQTQKQIIDNLIEQKLLSQYALTTDVTKEKEYKEQVQKIQQTVAFQLWAQQIGETIKVNDKELNSFYNTNKSMFKKPLELKASHILVKTKDEAEAIIKELNKSSNKKESFTTLAKTKSTGPSGPNGGDLGWFTKDKMVPEFSTAASELKKGAYTKEPVKTQFGFHIIFLDDTKPAEDLAFADVKEKIKQQISQEKFLKILKDKATNLKSKAKIQYK